MRMTAATVADTPAKAAPEPVMAILRMERSRMEIFWSSFACALTMSAALAFLSSSPVLIALVRETA